VVLGLIRKNATKPAHLVNDFPQVEMDISAALSIFMDSNHPPSGFMVRVNPT
jgi:hypothetical protein